MPHQVRAEETRSRILDAARLCFSRNGYDATSVSDICAEAGVTKGAFYYHFETKQALFLELLNSWLSQFDVQLLIKHSGGSTVAESLVEIAGATSVIFNQSTAYLPMFLEFWLHSIRDPVIWQMVIEPYRRYVRLFTQMMEEGQSDGSIQTTDPHLAAHALTALAIGMVLQGLMDPQGADWGKVTQESVRLLINGLGSKPD
jgi:AcrR family transcriptional regulator